ncbi:hypothetical protein LEMLEM_LOCUS11821 [Lemmus lemmus]
MAKSKHSTTHNQSANGTEMASEKHTCNDTSLLRRSTPSSCAKKHNKQGLKKMQADKAKAMSAHPGPGEAQGGEAEDSYLRHSLTSGYLGAKGSTMKGHENLPKHQARVEVSRLSFLLPESSLEDCSLAAPLTDFTLPPKRNRVGKNATAWPVAAKHLLIAFGWPDIAQEYLPAEHLEEMELTRGDLETGFPHMPGSWPVWSAHEEHGQFPLC